MGQQVIPEPPDAIPEPPSETAAAKPEHPWQAVNRAARDPGATIPGTENLAHPAEVIGGTASLLVPGGGALAAKALPQIPKLAAAGGRAITSGLIGAGTAAGKGESPVKKGLADAGIAAAFEAALSAAPFAKIPKVTSSLKDLAERVGGRKEQFHRATEAVDAAFDAIKSRLPAPGTKFLFVPALSSKKLSADEARELLKKADGATYRAARSQIFQELKEMDKRAAASPTIAQNLYTSKDFGEHTLKKRFQPPSSGAERFAEGAVQTLENPAVRAGVDVGAAHDVGGVPVGALPLLMGGGGDLKGFLRHLR